MTYPMAASPDRSPRAHRRRLRSAAAIIALLICGLPASIGAQAPPEVEFHFNYRPGAFEALSRNIGNVSLVVPEWFVVDGEGRLHGEVEERVLELARAHGVPVMAQVKNLDREMGAFRADWAHDLLTSEAARARAVARFLEISREHGLYGVQIELEGVHIRDRDALSSFVRQAAGALRQEGYRLSVSAIHREEESPGRNSYTAWIWEHWRGVYDLAALGEAADFVRAVVYAQHTRRTPPGPSQSLPWLRRVMRHFVESVPPEKLVMGLGMGASHWYTVADPDLYHIGARSWSRSVRRAELQALLDRQGAPPLTWDDRQKMAFSYFERAGVMEWVVSDNDVRALDAKLDLARELGLRGVSMWVNGDEVPGMWTRFSPRPLASGTVLGRPAPTGAPPHGGIPVLAWHYFVDSPAPEMGALTDTFERLEELLVFLKQQGYRSVFPEDARPPGLGGGRQVILTFDDGREEHLRAAEILERHGFTGIFFVIPDRTVDGPDVYLTGEEVARLARAGHRIAVHGYAHRSLAESGAEALSSLSLAYETLRKASGPPSTVEFAFPFGHYTARVAAGLAGTYRHLMTVNPGYWDGASTMVPRLLIFGDVDLDLYREYLTGAAAYAPPLRPLTPDGAVTDTVVFAIEGPLPTTIELVAVSPDLNGRSYASHPVGDALRVEGDTLVLDLRRHRDRYFPADRNALGYALVDRSSGNLRYLTTGMLHWLEDPAAGPRLDR